MEESEKRSVVAEPMEIRVLGYEVVEKAAKPCVTLAGILVPKDGVGKRVKAVR